MRRVTLRYLLFTSLAVFLLFKKDQLRAQTVPVTRFGLNASLEFLQFGQLVNEDVSLAIRPISLTSVADSIKWQYARPLNTMGNLTIHAPFAHFQYTRQHPYFRNDRGMGRSSGFQYEINLGFSFSEGIVHFQFRPSLVWNQYKQFTTFFDTDPKGIIPDYANWMNRIEQPDYQLSRNLVLPGDSYIRLEKFGFGLGVSSESLWWGPGNFHTLTMTNNAAGIPHFSLQTIEPKKTGIGSFEGRVILGQLRSAKIDLRDSLKYVFLDQNKYFRPDDKTRLINGLTFAYQPKWIKGLFVGYNSIFHYYRDQVENGKLYFLVFTKVFREKPTDVYTLDRTYDRYTSVFFRWRMDPELVIYGEFGSNKNDFVITDFLKPQRNGLAWIGGVSKYQTLAKRQNRLLFQLEVISMQQPASYARTHIDSWYIHNQIRQGYSHRGDVIGTGIGPGSNAQTVGLKYLASTREIGIRFERLAYNRDFYNFHFIKTGNFKKWWIDYQAELSYKYQKGPFILSGEMGLIFSFNYQWDNKTLATAANQIPFGNNQINPLVSTQIVYLPGFKKRK